MNMPIIELRRETLDLNMDVDVMDEYRAGLEITSYCQRMFKNTPTRVKTSKDVFEHARGVSIKVPVVVAETASHEGPGESLLDLNCCRNHGRVLDQSKPLELDLYCRCRG